MESELGVPTGEVRYTACVLLEFYRYPAEHWIYLANRLRHRRTVLNAKPTALVRRAPLQLNALGVGQHDLGRIRSGHNPPQQLDRN